MFFENVFSRRIHVFLNVTIISELLTNNFKLMEIVCKKIITRKPGMYREGISRLITISCPIEVLRTMIEENRKLV